MRHGRVWMAAGILLAAGHAGYAGQIERDYPVRPVPFTEVRVTDAFWAPRLETNRKVSIPYAFQKCEETGRIDNFAVAGKLKEGKFRGIYFNDSDVYKVVEGASYALALFPDPALAEYVDEVIAKIAAAQEQDGYLYTARTLMTPDKMPPGGKERWSDLGGGHELYCAGHMYEAAVAHFMATGKRTLLDVAIRHADLVCRVFGPGRKSIPDGHPEVEIGLGKLYRATGDAKYLEMAKFFLDVRGKPLGGRHLYGEYAQDHKPLLEQTDAVGHAVRAGYLYAGMADIAALTGDAAYVEAIDRLWDNVVSKKLYVTGGIGARGGGEAFGDNYELPNRSAYCETCAAIANALWNYRMFLLHADARYLDVLERVIYNGFLSGVAMEGDKFFYPNPLESHSGNARSPWFDCACCPSNVVRFAPSIPGYVYAHAGDVLYVNLFIGGAAAVKMDRRTVRLTQETRYPWDGTVRMTVEPDEPGEFTVAVRIPGWAQNRPVPSDLYRYADTSDAKATLTVNGKAAALDLQKGFARVRRRWQKGDTVELVLPMPVRRVLAHEKVVDDVGRVALERGPIVFCAEGHDNPDGRVLDLMVADDAPLHSEFRRDLLGGVEVIRTKAVSVGRREDGTPVAGAEQELVAIPCYAWAHRGPAPMTVWLARDLAAAKPLPGPTIAHTSKVTVSSGGDARALTDQLEPRSSIDHSNPFLHWWPRKGTEEWVQYDFKEPTVVSSVDVYWFDDTGIGECRLPASWRLKAKVDGQWRDVPNPSGYGVEKDKYNRTSFDPIKAEGLRLEVQLPEQFSAGIHEWRVNAAPAAGAVRYTVDTGRVTKEISLGIYGQFLEHICNSIHGGLWGDQILNGTIEPVMGDNPWIVAEGALASKKPVSDRLLLFGDDRWGDYELTVKAYKEAGEEGFWLVARALDTRHFWRANLGGWNNKEHGLEKNRHGWGARVPGSIETGRWYRLRMRCEGPRCQVWIDDTLVLDRTDSRDPLLNGCVGLNAWRTQVRYQDIRVTALDGTVLHEGMPPLTLPPPYWRLVGSPDLRFETTDAFNSRTSVRLVRGADALAGFQGLEQKPIALRQGMAYTLGLHLKGAPEVKVRVALVDPKDQVVWSQDVPAPGATWQKTVLTFTPSRAVDDAILRIGLTAPGEVWLDQVSLFSAEALATGGYRPDLLKAVADLKPASIRWPGGCFASQYIWKSGIGPRDKRVIHVGEIWEDRDTNQYGTDEFMRMCELVGADPILVLNTGAGVDNAMQWLEYCLGDETTTWGKVRAANGHPKPYRIPVLEIDNETWNMGQKGYAAVVEKFCAPIRAKYPDIKLSACGGYAYEEEEHGERKNWNKGLIAMVGKHIDFISPHYYNGLGTALDHREDPCRYEAYMVWLGGVIRASDNPAMKVYVSEWNPMTTDWRTGMYAGGILNGFERQADVVTMSCPALWLRRTWAQSWDNALINHDHRTWFPAPNYVVMKLWREHYAPGLLAVEGPERPLNLTATRSADGSRVYLKIVNPDKQAVTARVELKGPMASGQATMLIVAPGSENARNTIDRPDAVKPVPHPVTRDGTALVIAMPPFSAGAVTIAR